MQIDKCVLGALRIIDAQQQWAKGVKVATQEIDSHPGGRTPDDRVIEMMVQDLNDLPLSHNLTFDLGLPTWWAGYLWAWWEHDDNDHS